MALLLGFTATTALRFYCLADEQQKKIRQLRKRIENYVGAEQCANSYYHVCNYATYTTVVRSTSCNGYTHHTLIKVFDDEDNEFNLRQAQELADKLNEK